MSEARGARVWYIPDAYAPSGETDGFVSHEAICIINDNDSPVEIFLDFYFEDRDPVENVGPIIIGPKRAKHIRLDKPEEVGGFKVPRDVPYAIKVKANVPIVVQYSRMDVRHPNMTLMTTVAYPVK